MLLKGYHHGQTGGLVNVQKNKKACKKPAVISSGSTLCAIHPQKFAVHCISAYFS